MLIWTGKQVAAKLFISAMTLAELQRGVVKLPVSRRKKELSTWLEQLEARFEDTVLAFAQETAGFWA